MKNSSSRLAKFGPVAGMKTKYISVTNKFRILEGRIKLPNGVTDVFSVIDAKPVVVVIPVTKRGKIVLERQYRPSIKRWLWEIPAGVNKHDEPLKTLASKELKEETGYLANKWRYLFKTWAIAGSGNLVYHFFLAEGLVTGKQKLDKWETITTGEVTLAKAISMIKRNEITDAKTVMGLLFYYNFAKK